MTDLFPRIGVTVRNDSGLLIPPNSVVVVTFVELTPESDLVDAKFIHHITQYGCGLPGNVMVTGDISIRPKYKGRAYHDPFIYIALDPSVAVPKPGEEWGPQDGTWTITRGGSGFVAQGYPIGSKDRKSLFLRNYTRSPATACLPLGSQSSDSTSDSSNSSASNSDSSSGSNSSCGCITVVTGVSCGPNGLTVTTGQARGCC